MGSWYETGYDGTAREDERISQMSGPRRFWLPKGAERDIVFVDDEPFEQSGLTR
jgi:hypothetical protein